MKWTEQDKYHISSGAWTIAKYFSPTGVKYGLSKMNKNLGYFDTVEQAKRKAKYLLHILYSVIYNKSSTTDRVIYDTHRVKRTT